MSKLNAQVAPGNAFAMKTCAAEIDGIWVDVYKDPITDQGKRKLGPLADAMIDVYLNGNVLVDDNIAGIRARSNIIIM